MLTASRRLIAITSTKADGSPYERTRPVNASNKPDHKQPFPTFGSLAEAEAYSDKTGDAYFEICYHLEGKLNLCLKVIR